MTVTALEVRDEYTAVAGQVIFNYTFRIYTENDLNVYLTPAGQDADDALDLITGYSVTNVGEEEGGTVILNDPAALDDLVTIVSDIPRNRVIDYQNNGDFKPIVVNADFDRGVSQNSQVYAQRRGLTFHESQQNVDNMLLPPPEPGSFLVWNGAGDGLINVPVSGVVGPPINVQVVEDVFSGDGITTTFNLSFEAGSDAAVMPHVGGVLQATDKYIVAVNQLDFTDPPPLGVDNIIVRYFTEV